MSAIDDTPTNKNFLSGLKFKFQLMRAPHVEFFLQKVNLPGVSLPPTNYPNPLVDIPEPGDHLKFQPLVISFKVDEDLRDYMEIYSWMLALGKLGDYTALRTASPISGNGLKSPISIMLLTGTSMPNYQVLYHDAFPIDLSALDFDTTTEDVDYLTVTATFRYTTFRINKID